MTEHPERRGFDELVSDRANRLTIRRYPDDRFAAACDALIGEGVYDPLRDRLDRVEVQAREMAAMRGPFGTQAAAIIGLDPTRYAPSRWPGGIGERHDADGL